MLMRYRFTEITVEDILELIGRTDIPSNKVTIKRPSMDEETGEYFDIEIEISGEYSLSSSDEAKLESLMASMGLKLKEKI